VDITSTKVIHLLINSQDYIYQALKESEEARINAEQELKELKEKLKEYEKVSNGNKND